MKEVFELRARHINNRPALGAIRSMRSAVGKRKIQSTTFKDLAKVNLTSNIGRVIK